MPRIYNIRVSTGEYTDPQSGEKKKRYVQAGVIIEKNGRKYLHMEVQPVNWDGWALLMEPNDKDGDSQPSSGRRSGGRGAPARTGPAAAPQGGGFDDDDIPF